MAITLRDTFSTLKNDLYSLPAALASSTEVVDKFCKLILTTFSCNSSITQSFKGATTLYSTFGFVTTLNPMFDQDWSNPFKTSWEKRVSKVTLLGAQFIDTAKGLDALKLISFANISNTIGKVPVLSSVWSSFPLLTTVGGSLVLVSTGFSLLLDAKQYSSLANKVQAGQITKLDEKNIHNNRISIASNIGKAAIVALSLAIAAAGAYYGITATVISQTVLFATGYGVVTLGNFANAVGLFAAVTGFAKSIHTYATTK